MYFKRLEVLFQAFSLICILQLIQSLIFDISELRELGWEIAEEYVS
jgi:hypothetical protein